MQTLKFGDKSEEVRELQKMLNSILRLNLTLDGIYGKATQYAIARFQHKYASTSYEDFGVADWATRVRIKNIYTQLQTNEPLLTFGKERFVVFVDAGHGGIDDDGRYTTIGKRAYHPKEEMHTEGHYYEGHENRLVAEAFIEACTELGIMCIRTYHPYKDTSLSDRTNLVRAYLKRGYKGYLHSFHSNAISSSNSAQKLLDTRGFMVFTTLGNTLSDKIADKHYEYTRESNNPKWNYRKDKKDGDNDYEANFQILRETDLKDYHDKFGAILEEYGFHSSRYDAQHIIDSRDVRVATALKTALFVQKTLGA